MPNQIGKLLPLAGELTSITLGSSRFASFTPHLIADSDNMIAWYGIHTIEAFRQVGELAIARFLRICGIGGGGVVPRPYLHYRYDSTPSPPPQPGRGYKGYPIRGFGYASPIAHLYPPLIAGIAGFPRRPSRWRTAARASLLLIGGRPHFTPYLSPKLHTSPWIPDTAGPAAAQSKWGAPEKSLLPLELSIQSFLLYRLRFVLDADPCSDWAGFGGFGARHSHLSIATNLSAVETAGVALTYRNIYTFPPCDGKSSPTLDGRSCICATAFRRSSMPANKLAVK